MSSSSATMARSCARQPSTRARRPGRTCRWPRADDVMSAFDPRQAHRAAPDAVLTQIATYVSGAPPVSSLALATALDCLMDTLACGLMALKVPACGRLIGAWGPG